MISLARKPADAMVRPPAVRVGADDRDLVRQRRIGQRDGDAVVVRAHVERVLVRERNVDGGARRGALGERGDPRLAAAGRVAHHVAEHGGEHRDAVLLLAVHADDRGLAVALRLVRREQRDREAADVPADLGARVGERLEVALEAAGERIVDDGRDRDLAQRRIDALAGFVRDLVDEGQRPLDLHRNPSGYSFCSVGKMIGLSSKHVKSAGWH